MVTVDLTAKHIAECEMLEKRRYQSRTGNRGGLLTGRAGGGAMTEISRNGGVGGPHSNGAGGGGGAGSSDLEPIDADVEGGLMQ